MHLKQKKYFTSILIKCFIFNFFFNVDISCSGEYFKYEQLSSCGVYQTIKMSSFKNNIEVGYLYFINISFVKTAILYNLYIYPEYRNHGYGTELLGKGLDYIKKIGIQVAYIQPGPFEIEKKLNKKDFVYKDNFQRLIKLYKKCGFTVVHRSLRNVASLFYKICGIDENYDFLMMKNLK